MPIYEEELTTWKKTNGFNSKSTYADIPDKILWKYAGADADAVVRIGDAQVISLKTEFTQSFENNELKVFPLWDFFNELVMPLNHALIDMTNRGMVLDTDILWELQRQEKENERAATQTIYKMIGREINLASSAQLGVALFDTPPSGLGLPIVKKTPAGKPSTDEESLSTLGRMAEKELLETDPRRAIISQILAIRKSQKLISTYLSGKDDKTGILKFIKSDGRVHTDYKQHGTVTGRLSTAEPALHNMPKPDEDDLEGGSVIRYLFSVPRPPKDTSKPLPFEIIDGKPVEEPWFLITADYSQLELKIIAGIAQEDVLMSGFAEGRDGHQMVAGEIFKKKYEDVSKDERQVGKGINFALIYGQSSYSMAQERGWTVPQADAYIEMYFTRFNRLRAYIDGQKALIREQGYSTNPFGRKRRLYGFQFLDPARIRRYSGGDKKFESTCNWKREEMSRQGVNSGIQGGGSDLLSTATVRIHKEFNKREMKSGLVLSHHDALGIETPASELFEASTIMIAYMEQKVPQLGGYSYKADIEVGTRWGQVDEALTERVLSYISEHRHEYVSN